MTKRRIFTFLSVLVCILPWSVFTAEANQAQSGASNNANPPVSSPQTGETRTLLPDGRLLIAGGQDSAGQISATAAIEDQDTGTTVPLSPLNFARAWHSATVLPDGKILILGGIGVNGAVVSQAELFDPNAGTFQALESGAPQPRAFHTATLLTDGHVWIAGGASATGRNLGGTELWDPRQKAVATASVRLGRTRHNHSAALLADGRVLLWGGKDDQSNPLSDGEIFDPVLQTISAVDNPQALLKVAAALAELRASSPEDNATDVPIDALISMRFSRPLLMQSINARTASLEGPAGLVDATIVAAEGGMLGFITPKSPLVPGTSYTVIFSGGMDGNRGAVAFSRFILTTAGERPTDDGWIPTADWRTDRPASPWQAMPPLQAGPGITALAGQVLKLDGNPLAHVALIIGTQKAFTDASGRFLLRNIAAGHHALKINATTANTATRSYGIYEVGVDIRAGQTNMLNYTIWMTPLDTAHTVTISSPTLSETVITTPLIPGLELHLPANTVITGDDGRIVTQINITPIPLDRPPFPLPKVPVPIYFTIQPGSSYISVNSPSGTEGARLFYPNGFHFAPGTQFNFWNYSADGAGWFVYGQGRVSPDGSQVVPNPGVYLYEFTGAMVSNPNNAPPTGPHPGDPAGEGGEPVDLSTGLFLYNKTDLALPDVIPLSLTRTYRQNDSMSHAFGIGTNHTFDMFMVGSNNTTPGGGYVWQDLILPNGGRVHFQRISLCTGVNGFCDFGDAFYTATSTLTDFYGATLQWLGCTGGGAWTMKKKDGTVICFPDSDGSSVAQAAAAVSLTDRYGNSLVYTRDVSRNLTQITSPNGRWIKFTYDSSNRIIQAQDNGNRTVSYVYDAGGRLVQVTDANGGITRYTYDAFNEMLTIQDARGIFYLTNQYDSSGRVSRQIQADNSTYQYSYTTDPITGNITQVDLTDPRGNVRRTTFNANGYASSQIFALGRPEQQTITYVHDPSTNLVSSVIDALGRETDYGYDAMGNVTSITTMARTAAAATALFAYDPHFNKLTSITDPLSHTTTYQRDLGNSNLTAIMDPLGNQVKFAHLANGQVQSITDPLQNTIQFAYDSGDLVSITDPLGNTVTRYNDLLGRTAAITDALGNTTRVTYNAANLPLQVINARSGVTNFTYDANGNLLSLTDAQNHLTSWSYDNMDRVITWTDPLLRQESYQYDLNGNLISSKDRKGQVTSFAYDALDRQTFVGHNTVFNGKQPSYSDTITYAYDAANRITEAADSVGGAVIMAFDDVNRLTTEITPQGTFSRGFDSAGRQISATIAGQPQLSYSYDNANRLTQITQATSSVTLSYDNDDRRTSLTMPNGVTVSYSYDGDSHLTGITYQVGGTTLGNLNYSYDQRGQRTQVGGSFARVNLPEAVTSAAYDAANELTSWNGAAITYDANGNMLGDGHNSFVWNSRNQVAFLNGSALQYDAFGRRTVDATGRAFLFDGPNAIQELSGTTSIANILTGGIDEFLQRTDSSGAAVPLADAMGSVIALTNASGAITTTYTYAPFGNTTAAGAASANPSQYVGRANDGNGLYYYRTRYYSSILGRFISEDPIQFLGGANYYAYAFNSPTNYRDASGLAAGVDDLVLAVGGAIVGIGVQGAGDLLSGHLSDWQHYAGAAAGGAIGGLAIEYTGGVLSGALSGTTSNAVTQALEMLSGNQPPCFDFVSNAIDTGLGALGGALPDLKIPGASSGSNNYNAIAKTMRTKLANGTISGMNAQTAAKALAGANIAGAWGLGAAAVESAVGGGEAGSKAINKMLGRSCGCN
jgi:RHS repeat-associated protein